MDSSRSSRLERDSGRRRRSRSSSFESEERRQQRRRKEREMADREEGRGDRPDRELHDVRASKRRRSRSPYSEASRRRHEDYDRRHRSTQNRSSSPRPKREDRDSKNRPTRDRSPPHSSSKNPESGSLRDGSAVQLSRKSKGPLPSQAASFQANEDPSMAIGTADAEVDKQKPNFAPTGLLAAATKTIAQADGTQIVLKYHEPPEARKPPPEDEWKLFVFKGSEMLETIELSTRSCWLVGRELSVVDMPAEHPSISKQHAVIQFRYIEKKNEYGDKIGKVRPYIIDLDSANGTSLNKDEIAPSRYVELRDKDMIQLGHSTREYVLILSPQS